MLDQVTVNPAVNKPVNDTPAQHTARSTIRWLMPIVLLGLIVVIVSLFFMHWPSGSTTDATITVLHPQRITERLAEQGGAALPGVVLDIGVYVALIVGMTLVGIAGIRGARRPLPGLMIIGMLGLAYAGGMVLYDGPMISICGFMLMLFGGTVAWIASSPGEPLFDETMTDKSVPVPILPADAVELASVQATPIIVEPIEPSIESHVSNTEVISATDSTIDESNDESNTESKPEAPDAI